MRKKVLFITFILVGLLVTANLPIFKRLAITDKTTGKIVFISNLNSAREFFISFTHSVNRTPVEEYYLIDGDTFVVYKTVFSSYGAGMPDFDGAGGFEVKDGEITISGIDKTLQNFSVFVGTVAGHKLHINNNIFLLSDFSDPRSLLEFEIKRVSLMQILSVKGR